jgi:Acetyltransferase (GNAT) domain
VGPPFSSRQERYHAAGVTARPELGRGLVRAYESPTAPSGLFTQRPARPRWAYHKGPYLRSARSKALGPRPHNVSRSRARCARPRAQARAGSILAATCFSPGCRALLSPKWGICPGAPHPNGWGHGFASEAAGAVLERGSADGLPEVWAVMYHDKHRSEAVSRRIGMQLLGITHHRHREPLPMYWTGPTQGQEPSLDPDQPAQPSFSKPDAPPISVRAASTRAPGPAPPTRGVVNL